MDLKLEQMLWNAGQQKEAYTQEIWQEIIDVLLDDFQDLIKQDFQRDPKIRLYLEKINYPSFGRSIWTSNREDSPLSTVWFAVIAGDMVGIEEEGNVKNIFQATLTLFLFEASSKKRLCLTTGESIIEFVFEKQSDGRGYWRSLGWCNDEWGEWEDIEWE